MAKGDDSKDFTTALAHFYRGELQRTYSWRKRLDSTTNWAIILIAAMLTWTFSSETRLHFVLLIGVFLILLLSLVESRRYRTYVVWNSRVRVLQENFFAPLLCQEEDANNKDWCTIMAQDLKKPAHKIDFLEAFARRLRRIYNWLFLVLIGSWLAKLAIHPQPARSVVNVVERAKVGPIPGSIVTGTILCFLLAMFVVSFYRWRTGYGIFPREAKGEIRPESEDEKDWKRI